MKTMKRPEIADENNGFSHHLGKYPSLFARLALIFHFLEHGTEAPREVSKDIAVRVQRFIDEYLEPHARRLYGLVGAHKLQPCAARVAKWIREQRVERFYARDIRRKGWKEFNRENDQSLIDATLDFLEAHGWIRVDEKEATCRGGRPTREAIVNPRVHQEGAHRRFRQ
jgi:hypothetical protein